MSPTRANDEHKNLSISELISTPINTEKEQPQSVYPPRPIPPHPHPSAALPVGPYPQVIGQPIPHGFYVPCYPVTDNLPRDAPAGTNAREDLHKNMSQPRFPSLAQYAILSHPLPPPNTPKKDQPPVYFPHVVIPRFRPPLVTEPPEVNVANYNSPSRPFTCTAKGCEWAFARQSDLRRHLRSHNPPEYKCPFWKKDPTCHKNGGSFNRLDVLKRHLKLVHFIPDKSKPYVDSENLKGWCASCHKMFPCNKRFIDHCFECAGGPMPHQWQPKSPDVPDAGGYSQESSKLRRENPGGDKDGVKYKGGVKDKDGVKDSNDEKPPVKDGVEDKSSDDEKPPDKDGVKDKSSDDEKPPAKRRCKEEKKQKE